MGKIIYLSEVMDFKEDMTWYEYLSSGYTQSIRRMNIIDKNTDAEQVAFYALVETVDWFIYYILSVDTNMLHFEIAIEIDTEDENGGIVSADKTFKARIEGRNHIVKW